MLSLHTSMSLWVENCELLKVDLHLFCNHTTILVYAYRTGAEVRRVWLNLPYERSHSENYHVLVEQAAVQPCLARGYASDFEGWGAESFL